MKQKRVFSKFYVIFMVLVISLISVSSASANSFTVNDPLDPLWADGDIGVDYTFEITNENGSDGKIRRVEIVFPNPSWWLGTSDSCDVNDLPEGWILGSENSMCIYYTSNEEYMINPGETFNFMPRALTALPTGVYEWDVHKPGKKSAR